MNHIYHFRKAFCSWYKSLLKKFITDFHFHGLFFFLQVSLPLEKPTHQRCWERHRTFASLRHCVFAFLRRRIGLQWRKLHLGRASGAFVQTGWNEAVGGGEWKRPDSRQGTIWARCADIRRKMLDRQNKISRVSGIDEIRQRWIFFVLRSWSAAFCVSTWTAAVLKRSRTLTVLDWFCSDLTSVSVHSRAPTFGTPKSIETKKKFRNRFSDSFWQECENDSRTDCVCQTEIWIIGSARINPNNKNRFWEKRRRRRRRKALK